MNTNRMKAIVLVCALFLAAPVSRAEPFKVTPTRLRPEDIADVLDIHHWNFRVQFNPPVKSGLSLTVFELKRKADGSWERTTVAGGGRGWQHNGFEDVAVVVMIYESKDGPKCKIKRDGMAATQTIANMPDFKKLSTTFSDGKKIVDGCIVLAAEFKKEGMMSGQEADMVRILALEIKAVPD